MVYFKVKDILSIFLACMGKVERRNTEKISSLLIVMYLLTSQSVPPPRLHILPNVNRVKLLVKAKLLEGNVRSFSTWQNMCALVDILSTNCSTSGDLSLVIC